jgi:rifampicin phosphotransferase
MPDFIIPLGAHAVEENVRRMGHKAATLSQLMSAGFPVPPGLCIATYAFEAAIAPFTERIHHLVQSHNLHDPVSTQSAAGRIAVLLREMTLPAQLLQELTNRLPLLGDSPLAVRSSALLEDSAEVSFAGQYHTSLGVEGIQAVAETVLTCWRSYYSANALAARARIVRQYPTFASMPDSMAVLIQPLILAECSGVCFTADPVQQRGDVLLVTAAWGLGAGVVDGTMPTDTSRIQRSDLACLEVSIADKHSALQYLVGQGVQPRPVDAAQRYAKCLPEPWLARVAQFGLAVEQHLGQPQDVEWAISEEQFWVLQSRPITALPTAVRDSTHFPVDWTNPHESRQHWHLNRHNQRASAVLLPAEVAFIETSSQGGQLAVQLAGGARTRKHRFVNGRMYISMTASAVSPADQRVLSAVWRDLFERLQHEQVTLWEHWGPEIERATQRLGAFDDKTADGDALADHLEDVLAAARHHWMIHTLMPRPDVPPSLLESYIRLTDKPASEAEANIRWLLQGAGTAQTRLIESLYDLAQVPVDRPEDLARALQAFLADYGGRFTLLTHGNDGESAFVLPMPWREAPEHVMAMIERYRSIHDAVTPPREARAQVAFAQQASVDAVCAAANDPVLVNDFRDQLAYFRRNMAFLDEHNHHIDQLSEGQYAQALLYCGRWLTQRGDLTHPYDVFWLHPDQINAALRMHSKQELGTCIADRRVQFDLWCTFLTPVNIGLPSAVMPERPAVHSSANLSNIPRHATDANSIFGQTVNLARGKGSARLITANTSLTDVHAGDVLVAVNLGPEWTPIFPILAGIVLEHGHPVDHTAITAREFGVAAIFDVAQATRRIPLGANVVVNGHSGEVTWD